MSSIWRRGTATAEQVREDLAPRHKLKESTIRTLLGRLEKKGHLQHSVEGRTYVYTSLASRDRSVLRSKLSGSSSNDSALDRGSSSW